MKNSKNFLFNKLELFNALFILLVFIGFIIGFFICFTVSNARVDTTPASQEDFAPLYKQKQLLETDFSSILSMENVELISSGDSKVVTLTSKKCNLTIKFDSQLNVTSIREKDNSTPVIRVVLFSCWAGLFSALLLAIVLVCFIFLPKSIKEKPGK